MKHNTAPPLIHILADVCSALDTPIENVLSKSRKRAFAWPRHIFCYVAFFYTGHSITEISKIVGGRDHTTAIHSRNTVADYINKNDSDFMLIWERYKETSAIWAQLKFMRVTRSIHA